MASLKVKEVFCLIYSGLLFISGVLLIGFSAYLLFKIFYHYTFIPSEIVGPFFTLIFLGITHLFLCWLGIQGPKREHNFHIVLFMVFTVVLLGCEFAVGIWSIILRDEVELKSVDLMTSSFNEMITSNYVKDWNKLQKQLHCCGINGINDYKNRTGLVYLNETASCILDLSKSNNITSDHVAEGCKLLLIKYVKRILMNGAILSFMSAIFHGIGLFTFCTYFKTLREERGERIARRSAIQREMANSNPIQSQNQGLLQNATPKSADTKEPSSPSPPAGSSSPPTTPPVTAPPN